MAKNSSKPLYKRLNELSLIVASNLREVDKEYIEEILETISNTRVSIYSEIFEEALDYFKIHKKMPDFDYVNMHFPSLMGDLEDEEPAWHDSFTLEFLTLLNKDSVLQDITKAAAQDNIDQIDQILASNEKIFHDDATGKLPTWDDYEKNYEKLKSSKKPLKWGVKELDELYNGLAYGTCNILAAPPGKFKTTTMVSIAKKNINDKRKVLYITLEDSWDIIYSNIAANESYEQDRLLSASQMKIGDLSEEDEKVFHEVIQDCKKKYEDCFKVACQQSWSDFTPSGMLRLIKKAKKEMQGLDMVILDHASLTKFYRVRGISDPKEIINFYVRFLTNLSISFEDKFVLLLASQTNRDGIKELEAGKTGSLTNLAEANEMERSAATVTLIYSGVNAVESNIINFYPKKNRRGALTAKPIISFIEPAAYFVGERAVAGSISLDDLMEDMDQVEEGFDTTNAVAKSARKTKSLNKTVSRQDNETKETKEEPDEKQTGLIKRRKIKRIGKS